MDLIKNTMKLTSKDLWHMSEKEITSRLKALYAETMGANREEALKAKKHLVCILGRIGIAVFYNTRKGEYVITFTDKFRWLQEQRRKEAS